MEGSIRGFINRNEVRRLEKAAREKDKKYLYEWAAGLAQQIDSINKRKYLDESVNCFEVIMLAMIYTLYFSEENSANKHNVGDFLYDFYTTFDMFRTGEYKAEDYKEQLLKEGIEITYTDYNKIYKDYIRNMNTDLVNMMKSNSRQIITIISSRKFKDIVLQKEKEFTIHGNIVFTDGNLTEEDDLLDEQKGIVNSVLKDKILISNEVYVINKDGYTGPGVDKLIEYAKQQNKVINYLEEI